MSEIVPPDFLAGMPAYLEAHPTANPYLAFVMTANLADVAARGLIQARDRGVLARIEGSEEHGFTEGENWNRLAAGEALDGFGLSLAVQPLLDSLHAIAQKEFRRLDPKGGEEILPVRKVMTAANRAAREIEKWLENPVQNLRESRFPASTNLINRERLHAGEPCMCLLQLNGWGESTLYQRGHDIRWRKAAPEPVHDEHAMGL
ncbi:hypothetical protein [Paracoccus sp. ME4]|uniref:hypothetical protein n=1 Tax=Paracoccus sp. ME4 TaxID=3138066 RepID=UPI00398B6115